MHNSSFVCSDTIARTENGNAQDKIITGWYLVETQIRMIKNFG